MEQQVDAKPMRRVSRRAVLTGAISMGTLGAGYGLSRWGQTLPPRDASAEGRYEEKQNALLNFYAVPFQSHYFQIPSPNLRVHVLEAGHGEPVLMIHGGNASASQWVPLMARLQPNFHLFVPDRPGCGLTQMFNYNKTGKPFRQHAVDFVESTMNALGLRTATLIGNSMGGFFSLAFALAHPERVTRLITIGEPAGSSPSVPFMFRMLGTRGVNRLLYATIMKPSEAATRDAFQRLLVADVRKVPKAFIDCDTAASLIPGATESWLTMVQNTGPLTYALRPDLKNLNVPTLMIWGDKDAFGQPERGAEMVALMPNANLDIVHDAGHLAWLDQIDECGNLVTAFMRSEKLSAEAARSQSYRKDLELSHLYYPMRRLSE
jgi:pimeloyl-ACP methyl ester carboxylesterase